MVDVACQYQPVMDRVLIKLDPVQNKSAGGILLTDDFEPVRNSGTILALGPNVKADVAVGDRVLFHCFDEIKVLDDDCAVVRDNSLLLKF